MSGPIRDSYQPLRRPDAYRCKWYPSPVYPHHKKWYSTFTYLSPNTGSTWGHNVYSGAEAVHMVSAQRKWGATTPPARNTYSALPLAWPYEKLAGDLTTADSLVGCDFYNLPRRLYGDLVTWCNTNSVIGSAANGQCDLYMRVNAYKHTLTFHNYNKHPLKVFYRVINHKLPATPWSSLFATGTPLDIANQRISSIIVPGVLDSGDKAQSRTLTITHNQQGTYQELFDRPPHTFEVEEYKTCPWARFYVDRRTSTVLPMTSEPTQLETIDYATPVANASQGVNLLNDNLELAFQYQTGVWAGPSANIVVADGQVTSGTDVVVSLESSWLVEWLSGQSGADRTNDYVTDNNRAKAYPSQTA